MRVFRLTALLEEVSRSSVASDEQADIYPQKWSFYAKDRKIIRSPQARKYEMLKIQSLDGSPLLPIISEDADALQSAPLADWIVDSGSSEGRPHIFLAHPASATD